MKLKGYAITVGLGMAAGAVAAAMLPKQCTAKKLVNKAAYAVEDAAEMAGNKLSRALEQ